METFAKGNGGQARGGRCRTALVFATLRSNFQVVRPLVALSSGPLCQDKTDLDSPLYNSPKPAVRIGGWLASARLGGTNQHFRQSQSFLPTYLPATPWPTRTRMPRRSRARSASASSVCSKRRYPVGNPSSTTAKSTRWVPPGVVVVAVPPRSRSFFSCDFKLEQERVASGSLSECKYKGPLLPLPRAGTTGNPNGRARVGVDLTRYVPSRGSEGHAARLLSRVDLFSSLCTGINTQTARSIRLYNFKYSSSLCPTRHSKGRIERIPAVLPVRVYY